MHSVRKKVVDLTWLEQPFLYPEFENLVKYSDCFMNDAIFMIESHKDDPTMVGLALWSMSNLNTDETLFFTNSIINFIDEDHLSVWLLGAYGNKNFINNYSDERYFEFLNVCKIKYPTKIDVITEIQEGKIDILD